MTDSPSRELGLSLIGLGVTFTLFLLLGALLSWLAGQARLVLSLATGLAVFLGAAFLASLIATALAKALRWNVYDHSSFYIALNLLASGSLTIAWVARAAKLVEAATLHASWWQGGMLYLVGLIATVVAVQIVQEFFQGEIYRLVSAILGLVGYAVWGAWAAFN